MNEDRKTFIEWFSDDHNRRNVQTGLVTLSAIAIVIITKGMLGGFSWDLFFTLEPYASGIGIGIAYWLVQDDMINRAYFDEVDSNKPLQKELEEIEKLDRKLTNYDYVEWFVDEYNTKEYERLKKIATSKEIKRLKFLISIKKSAGRKYTKLQQKLDYTLEYGAKVKNYQAVGVQDLLSFQSTDELKGKDKINFNPITNARKKVARSRLTMFLVSGFVAGLPLSQLNNTLEILVYLAIWLPMLSVTAFRTYTNVRNSTKTVYPKSLQYKKNVLTLCVDKQPLWKSSEEVVIDDDVIDKNIDLIETQKKED